MQASDLYFNVPDTCAGAVVAAKAGARVQGAADALADLLSRDAVKRYAGFAVDPTSVKGQFQGQLTIDLAMGKGSRPEDQKFRAEGTLSDLKLDKFMPNERFEQGALEVVADAGALKITGQGVINGLPAKVELAKGAADEGALTLNLTLDDAARAKLGMTAGPPMTGPMAVRIKAPLNKSGADVEVDLARVEIASPDGGESEAGGQAGQGDVLDQAGRRIRSRSTRWRSTPARSWRAAQRNSAPTARCRASSSRNCGSTRTTT